MYQIQITRYQALNTLVRLKLCILSVNWGSSDTRWIGESYKIQSFDPYDASDDSTLFPSSGNENPTFGFFC